MELARLAKATPAAPALRHNERQHMQPSMHDHHGCNSVLKNHNWSGKETVVRYHRLAFGQFQIAVWHYCQHTLQPNHGKVQKATSSSTCRTAGMSNRMPKCQPSKLANVSTTASSPTCGTAGMSNRFLLSILACWQLVRWPTCKNANRHLCSTSHRLVIGQNGWHVEWFGLWHFGISESWCDLLLFNFNNNN